MSAEIIYFGPDGCPLFARRLDRTGAGEGPLLLLIHGGGPDHESLIPLARRLTDLATVVLPDVRGYGRSICTDPDRHRWTQYAVDVVALLDHLQTSQAVIGGAGLGGTIALRTALEHRARTRALLIMSLEDIEDDDAKAEEIRFMEAFAARVRAGGVEAGWRPILPQLAPVIASMVEEAMPRATAESLAAAAAVGYDRAFRSAADLAEIDVPALIFPGMDWRHPGALAEEAARVMPQGWLSGTGMSAELRTSEDFADAMAPPIREFLCELTAG